MIEPMIGVMGGVLIAVVSGAIGKVLGNNGKVKDSQCIERREACTKLLTEKIDNLIITVDGLKDNISNIKTV